MINYLSRHANPVPFILVNPSEIAIFGEKAILNSFQALPPDYIILAHRDSEEHGTGFFGLDKNYGKESLDWINSHYEAVWRILAEPLKDGRFGIKIMKRK